VYLGKVSCAQRLHHAILADILLDLAVSQHMFALTLTGTGEVDIVRFGDRD
jgi:hypothetical protein